MGGELQQLKIGRKFLLGFGTILVILAVLVAVAVMNMSALHEDLVRIVLLNNKRLTIATGMATIVREEAIAVRNCFIQKERINEMIKRINDYNVKFDEAFKQVDQMTSGDDTKGREILLLVRKSWSGSRELNERTLGLLSAGRQQEAFAIYEKESRAAVRQAIQAAEDLVKHQQTLSEMRYENATRHYRDTRIFMISIGFAALLLVIIIAIRF